MDANGKEIVPPMYERACPFSEKMAAVVFDGTVGFIDLMGKEVIACQYEPDFSGFEPKEPQYHAFYSGFADMKLNGKWGVIDKNNRVALPFLYDKFLENINVCWRYAVRDGKKVGIDTKGNEWMMQKNPTAKTFKDYLLNMEWAEVEAGFRSLLQEEDPGALKIYEIDFHNLKTKQYKPSQDIIRIFSRSGKIPIDAALYSTEDGCAYVFFDWAEILDMEVRVEDNLALSDGEIVAACIWETCDQVPEIEGYADGFLNSVKE
jgi:hypothetical protein